VGVDLVRLAEDLDLRPALHEPLAERSLGLIPDDHDRVSRVRDRLLQMVQNSAPFAHARRGDRHERPRLVVQLHRIGGVAHELDPAESQRILSLSDRRRRLVIEHFRMPLHDRLDVRRERAVHEDLHVGNPPGGDQAIERVDDLLGPPHREGGDHDPAPPLDRAADDPLERAMQGLFVGVGLSAVGALDDQPVGVRKRQRVPDDRPMRTSEVSGEDERSRVAVPAPRDPHGGRAHDMAGLVKGRLDAGDRFEGRFVVVRDELGQRLLHVAHAVERLIEPAFVLPAIPAPGAVQPFGVLLLDVRGVEEHRAAQISGRGRGVDRPLEPASNQERDRAAMIDVGVGEDQRVDRSRMERERPISGLGLGAAPLEEPAVEQHGAVAAREEMLRPGHGPRRAPERDAHRTQSPG
jgi:hypothetical protein